MNYQTALQRAAALCAGSEHCCHDIREKLQRWEVSGEDAERIIEYLVNEKYIDESRFCRAYAKDKMRYSHWGRIKIDQGMRMLGLDATMRREALEELPEEEYASILQNLLKGKLRSIKARNAYERNAKLMRFALGRGFESQLIREYLPDGGDEDGEFFPDDD